MHLTPDAATDLLRESTGASFRLKDAAYLLEDMPVWRRWPYPPIVTVRGLKVWYPNSEFLFISEGSPALAFNALRQIAPGGLQ